MCLLSTCHPLRTPQFFRPRDAACEIKRNVYGSSCAAALVTASLGMASFSMCGLYCNHADLSPRYAPFLLGMTNTVGALPGIVGQSLPHYTSFLPSGVSPARVVFMCIDTAVVRGLHARHFCRAAPGCRFCGTRLPRLVQVHELCNRIMCTSVKLHGLKCGCGM